MGAKKRLFIAVDPAPDVAKAVASAVGELRTVAGRLSWSREDALHITLKFLGATDVDLVERVKSEVSAAAAATPAFSFKVRGAGSFPDDAKARVLWIGIEDGGVLAKLAAELDRRLEPLGFEREHHAFTPHLTIARARETRVDAARLLAPWREVDFGETRARELILYESFPGPGGSKYVPLIHAAFG
jgi:2'-5' RNA ligase